MKMLLNPHKKTVLPDRLESAVTASEGIAVVSQWMMLVA